MVGGRGKEREREKEIIMEMFEKVNFHFVLLDVEHQYNESVKKVAMVENDWSNNKRAHC